MSNFTLFLESHISLQVLEFWDFYFLPKLSLKMSIDKLRFIIMSEENLVMMVAI